MALDGYGSSRRETQEIKMQDALANGWEPFAVVPCGGGNREVWLRRMEMVNPDR